MQFVGTRIIGITNQYVVADVVSDGAILSHSVNVDEYITNLLGQIETLKAEVKNLDEGAKLLHSLATGGESKLLKDWDLPSGTPEYKEAQKVSDNFNFDTVTEQEF